MPLQAQVKLLKVLQTKEIERVGGLETIKLNIRIIAATNRNLEEMVGNSEFREDLWFRLNVFPIWIPPLREKIRYSGFVTALHNTKAKELKLPHIPKLKTGAINLLLNYDWPGNVRELQNIVERILILDSEGPLTFENIICIQQQNEIVVNKVNFKTDNLDEINIQHINRVLTKTNGKIHGNGGAAELLGVNSNTLRNKMNKLGIQYKKKQNR